MQTQDALTHDYPKTVDLLGEEVRLRLMQPADAAELHNFFAAMPPEDILFLQRDVTDTRAIDAWATEIEQQQAVTLLAESTDIDMLLGESTLHLSRVPWTSHVASVRVITHPSQRGRGLGRLLLTEMFGIASRLGMEKIVAEMTVEQTGAQRLFEQLGFRQEGRYHAYVKDRQGRAHDLLVMTYDQPDLGPTATQSGTRPVAWRCDACGHVTSTAGSLTRCPDCGASAEHLTLVEDGRTN